MKKLKIILNSCLYLIISSTSILLNKYLYINIGFPNISLTFLHFFTAFIGLHISEKCSLFSVKSVHLDIILLPAILYCTFVTYMNLSLANNSLASYHVSKTMVTPIIIFIQSVLYRKWYSLLIYITLIIIIIGAVLVLQNDSYFNTNGIYFMLTAVLVTVLYELVLKVKQSELQMSKIQLLYYFAPFSSFLLAVCLPLVESPLNILVQHWTTLDIVLIFLSCLVVFLNNLVTNWIIANSTFILCNVLMQIKLSLILYGSWYLFDEDLLLNQLLGFSLNIAGCLMYQMIKMREFQTQGLRRII